MTAHNVDLMSPHFASTEYEDQLDRTDLEWLRVRIWTVDGRVIRFMVQYETMINEHSFPVARYDTAHGYAHRDLLDRNGEPRAPKEPIDNEFTLDDALQLAVQDLRRHWREYRRDF
jgi:hypothetical protein